MIKKRLKKINETTNDVIYSSKSASQI